MRSKLKIVDILGVIGILLVNLFVLYECTVNFRQAEKRFESEISHVFQKAVTLEKEKKVIDSKLFITSSYNEEDTSRYIKIENSEEKYNVEKLPELKEYTIAEKEERMLQTVFRMENPIQPVVLDSFFNVLLAKNVHISHTAVRYKDNKTGRVLYSVSDTTSLKSAYHTKGVLTGIENEISLQGYVFVSWWEIAREEKGHILRLLLVWILMVGSVCISFIVFRRKMKNAIPAPSPISCSPEQVVIRLTPELYWDIDLAKLMRNGEIVVPLTAQCTQMMILFLEKPGHFVSRDELFDLIASGKDTLGAKDRLDQAIRRFRKSLEAVPEIRVENDRGKGYVLTIFSETSEDVVKQCVNNDLEVRGD